MYTLIVVYNGKNIGTIISKLCACVIYAPNHTQIVISLSPLCLSSGIVLIVSLVLSELSYTVTSYFPWYSDRVTDIEP